MNTQMDVEHMPQKDIVEQISSLEKSRSEGNLTPAQARRLNDLRQGLRVIEGSTKQWWR